MPILGIGYHISNPARPDVPKIALGDCPFATFQLYLASNLEQTVVDCSIIDSQLFGRPVAK